MASSNGGGREEEQLKRLAEELSKNLKEGERILAPTRRPDGTLRKPIRIRAGYVPQEEVAIYQSKGTLWKKEMSSQVGPPGYDPELDTKPKTKSVKRNERKKEKRLQAALEKGKNLEQTVAGEIITEEPLPVEDLGTELESVKQLTSQMNELAVSTNATVISPPLDSTKESNSGNPVQDIDKRIRALKKKIRLTEAQQQKSAQDMKPEQVEKWTKLEGWRKELKLLEDKKAERAVS
ncbi:partner of Y14 and mago-like [Juglans microcarpa x Juglans regia]|uniref:partner of Y14 and mago-like n=1 Tax=Juglans microcarpa x Juglans regia TaxID=2249226 RepID=UPI001B7ECC9D|nr:partner of Y14 and mago-like [Juglans microcarpa x Juglans regia]